LIVTGIGTGNASIIVGFGIIGIEFECLIIISDRGEFITNIGIGQTPISIGYS